MKIYNYILGLLLAYSASSVRSMESKDNSTQIFSQDNKAFQRRTALTYIDRAISALIAGGDSRSVVCRALAENYTKILLDISQDPEFANNPGIKNKAEDLLFRLGGWYHTRTIAKGKSVNIEDEPFFGPM